MKKKSLEFEDLGFQVPAFPSVGVRRVEEGEGRGVEEREDFGVEDCRVSVGFRGWRRDKESHGSRLQTRISDVRVLKSCVLCKFHGPSTVTG